MDKKRGDLWLMAAMVFNACEKQVSHAKKLLSSHKSGGGFCDASYTILKTYMEHSL